jgi:hypothetical protein
MAEPIAPAFCFDAFSSREAGSTLENSPAPRAGAYCEQAEAP